ncbi:MAG TPA: type II secretion system F family protein, partial [Luteimonas sp.]|nr:type II secretion system F family protein [Luteimonas sp.]
AGDDLVDAVRAAAGGGTYLTPALGARLARAAGRPRMAPLDVEPEVGAIFAGHRVEGVAGRGGMGVVLRARDVVLDRLVALKLIAPVYARDPVFRARFDEWILRQKFAGSLLAKMETARLARTLGTLLRNGVPLLTALGIGRNVLGNRALADNVEAAADDVKNGIGLSAALAKGKRFPRLALQMIQVGEESGALDSMLLKTADTFEQETSLALDRMLAALVPVVTLLLAGIVGVVIMSVLVPIYGLTNVIG